MTQATFLPFAPSHHTTIHPNALLIIPPSQPPYFQTRIFRSHIREFSPRLILVDS